MSDEAREIIDQERITPISANCPKRYGKAEPPLRARMRYNLITHTAGVTATVMNIAHALHWLAGDRPAQTRSSAFA